LPAPSAAATAQGEIASRILDRLVGDAALHVVGHSLGAQVAIELALRVPGRVRTLTILCSRAAAASSMRIGRRGEDGTSGSCSSPPRLTLDRAALITQTED
jgi:pimeloyl-ACP methyl ester carboxylesterase